MELWGNAVGDIQPGASTLRDAVSRQNYGKLGRKNKTIIVVVIVLYTGIVHLVDVGNVIF